MNISATSKTKINASMLFKARMKKDKLFKSVEEPMVLTKDGRYSMLIREKRMPLRASTRSMVSTLTDHSTSDQDFHSKELLSAMVPTTFG
jgi:hypothetical protein